MTKSLPYTDLFIDFDDTLYDTRGNATVALRELHAQHDLQRYYPDVEEFVRIYWIFNEQLWHAFASNEISKELLLVERFRLPLAQAGKGEPSTAECQELSESFFALNASKGGTIAGAHDLLDYLSERGYRLHLCSNGFGEVQYKKIEMAGLKGYFETITLSEEAGANKPAKAFFDYAFAKTGAQPQSTLMIGDNPYTDILGAQQAGMDTIWFNEQGKDSDLETPPTHEVGVLEEIRNLL